MFFNYKNLSYIICYIRIFKISNQMFIELELDYRNGYIFVEMIN